MVPFRLREPGNLFVTIRKKALSAFSVGIVPDNQVRKQHSAVLAHIRQKADEIPTTGFSLILQSPKDSHAAGIG